MEEKKNNEGLKRYEFIKEADKNLWTYGSPIIIESSVLEKDTVSKNNRLTLKKTKKD